MTVHTFGSTVEAYAAVNCDDNVEDGDVLVVPDEGVAGVAYSAWPVAVTENHGAFHALADDATWDTFMGGKYREAADTALAALGDV